MSLNYIDIKNNYFDKRDWENPVEENLYDLLMGKKMQLNSGSYIYFVVLDNKDYNIQFNQHLCALFFNRRDIKNGKSKVKLLIETNELVSDYYNEFCTLHWNFYKKNSDILYIGKSERKNNTRIDEYVKTGRKIINLQKRTKNIQEFESLPKTQNHLGGKVIWQIGDINQQDIDCYKNFKIIAIESKNSHISMLEMEHDLLDIFEITLGCLPVANRKK